MTASGGDAKVISCDKCPAPSGMLTMERPCVGVRRF